MISEEVRRERYFDVLLVEEKKQSSCKSEVGAKSWATVTSSRRQNLSLEKLIMPPIL
jgi:hypothetical protein